MRAAKFCRPSYLCMYLSAITIRGENGLTPSLVTEMVFRKQFPTKPMKVADCLVGGQY